MHEKDLKSVAPLMIKTGGLLRRDQKARTGEDSRRRIMVKN